MLPSAAVCFKEWIYCFFCALLFLMLGICFACTPRRQAHFSLPSTIYQWPAKPQKAKITYVSSLSGFYRPSSFLRKLAGSNQEKEDAFLLPVAVAVSNTGNIAVADMGCRCVHLYTPASRSYVRLSMESPVGLIFDDENRLYVSDSTAGVRVFGPEGVQIAFFREPFLQRPTGLAYSSEKQVLYVVDTLAGKVHILNREGKWLSSFGERGEQPGQFNFPTHIFRSAEGTLFITDSLNFRIQMFDDSGRFLGLFGKHGNGSGDFALPKGIAVDSDGIVYVVDAMFDNVQLFDQQGNFLLTLGRRGNEFGEFWLPSGIFLYQDLLYVCDTYNRRIQIFKITQNKETP